PWLKKESLNRCETRKLVSKIPGSSPNKDTFPILGAYARASQERAGKWIDWIVMKGEISQDVWRHNEGREEGKHRDLFENGRPWLPFAYSLTPNDDQARHENAWHFCVFGGR